MTGKIRQTILIFGDIAIAFFSLFLTLHLRYWQNFTFDIFKKHLFPFSIVYIIWFIILYIFNFYDLKSIRFEQNFLIKTANILLSCLVVGMAFFYLVPSFGITPKTNLLLNTVVFGILFLGWRYLFYLLFSSLSPQKVAILGNNQLAKRLVKEIESLPQLGYRFVKFLDNKKPFPRQIKEGNITTIVIAEDISRKRKLVEELYKCISLKVSFMDLNRAYEIILQKIPIDFASQSWFLENLREGKRKTYDKIKRVFDIFGAVSIIIITLPVWPIIVPLIKLEDKGPIFYKQKRVGKDKKQFLLWKLRSMKEGAEKGKAVWAKKNDQRITKIGRFLRKSHLDELPQMINILKGDISLVGPRPERPEFVKRLEKEIPHYHLRHLIKPGFTGWAQIKFRYARSTTESHEKFQYDLYYIKNRSFFLDLGILLKTFQLFFKKEK